MIIIQITKKFFLLFLTVNLLFLAAPGTAWEIIEVDQTTVDSSLFYAQPKAIKVNGVRTILDDLGRTPDHVFNMDLGEMTIAKIESKEEVKINNTAIYSNLITLRRPMNYYTLASIQNIATQIQKTINWLEYWEYKIDWLGTKFYSPAATTDGRNPAQEGYKKDLSYTTMQLKGNYLNSPIYDYQDLEMEFGIHEKTINLASLKASIQFKLYDSQLLKVQRYGSPTYEILEQYTDYFEKSTGNNLVSVSVNDPNSYKRPEEGLDVPALSNDLKDDARDELLSESIGVRFTTKFNTVDGSNKFTEQQGQLFPIPDGNKVNQQTLPSPNTAATITLPLRIRPTIYSYKEDIAISKGIMWVRYAFGNVLFGDEITSVAADTGNDERNSAVRVENYVCQQYLEMQYKIYSKIELTGDVRENALLDAPELIQSDMIWNTLITGDTGMAVGFARNYDFGDFMYDTGAIGGAIMNALTKNLTIIFIFIAIGIGMYFIVSVVIPKQRLALHHPKKEK